MNKKNVVGESMRELSHNELNEIYGGDIVNIGLHFILKNVRPYAAPCSEA